MLLWPAETEPYCCKTAHCKAAELLPGQTGKAGYYVPL